MRNFDKYRDIIKNICTKKKEKRTRHGSGSPVKKVQILNADLERFHIEKYNTKFYTLKMLF